MTYEDFDLEEDLELGPQPLVPITNNPLPLGPKAKPKKKVKTRKATAEQYRKWIQKFLYFLQLPMSNQSLNRLSVGELRVIASMFRRYDGVEIRSFNKNELLRFIAGVQQEQEEYLPIEKIAGVRFPELSDQEYRQIFQSKRDPWRGPI